jgi:hypothetical protein
VQEKVRIIIYPMPEISDFQRTNSEFAKSEKKYPVKGDVACADFVDFATQRNGRRGREKDLYAH